MGADCARSNHHDLLWESMRLIGFLVLYSPHHLKDTTKGANKKKKKPTKNLEPKSRKQTPKILKPHTLFSPLNSGNHLQASLMQALFQPPVVLANPLVSALSSLGAWDVTFGPFSVMKYNRVLTQISRG